MHYMRIYKKTKTELTIFVSYRKYQP